jgi:hypothetical protein
MHSYLKHYLWRILVFLGMIFVITGVLYESLIQAYLNNIWLNSAILMTLTIGIWLVLRQISQLAQEQRWLTAFDRGEEQFPGLPTIKVLVPLSVAASQGQMTSGNMPSLLNSIDARLDEQRDINRYLVGLLIFLGLLGTFWGLSQTIGAIAGVVSGIDVSSNNLKEAFHTLKQGLQSPLAGMGTAFSSSMFGLASSLILGFLDLQISKASTSLFNRVEERLLLLLNYHPAMGSGKAYNLSLMEQNAEGLAALQRLVHSGEENRRSVVQTVTLLSEKLAQLTELIHQQQQTFAKLNHNQTETLEQLKVVAKQLHHTQGDNIRDYLRNLDGLTRKLLDEMIEGRAKTLTEIRSEIRLVARTISALAEGHEEAA